MAPDRCGTCLVGIEQGDVAGARTMPQREMAQTFVFTKRQRCHGFGHGCLAHTIFTDDDRKMRVERNRHVVEAAKVL